MPVIQLTKRNIDGIPFVEKGQKDYFERDLKGLFLRVGKSSKTFYARGDVRESDAGKYQTGKAKIGRYGEITAEQARQKCPARLPKINLRGGKTRAAVNSRSQEAANPQTENG